MNKKYTSYFILLSMMILLGSVTNPYQVISKISNSKSDYIPSEVDSLYKEIQSFRNQQKIKPSDAKIDRVWRAIPGYNGLDVNIEARLQKNESSWEV